MINCFDKADTKTCVLRYQLSTTWLKHVCYPKAMADAAKKHVQSMSTFVLVRSVDSFMPIGPSPAANFI